MFDFGALEIYLLNHEFIEFSVHLLATSTVLGPGEENR